MMRKYSKTAVARTLAAGLATLVASELLQAAPGPGRPPDGDGATPITPGLRRVQAIADLGSQLFFDSNLSSPAGQSCASCHDPAVAFTDPRGTPTSEGAIIGRFGSRNAPPIGYTAFVPAFRFDADRQAFVGGLFRDGRAASLEEQAKGPFLNPLEMNDPDVATLIDSIKAASYAQEFETVFGSGALDDPATAFDLVASALATFERSAGQSPFTTKFDAVQAGQASFTAEEQHGSQLFFGRAGCSACHNSLPRNNAANPPQGTQVQVFSNFGYENIGAPPNPGNLFYSMDSDLNPDGNAFVDRGLGAIVGSSAENGKFRVPSLRNIELTAPYMHNGVFASLEEVVHFYNSRDVDASIAAPEVADNISRRGGIGNLRLSQGDLDDLVSFLRTLTDQPQ